MDKYFKSLSSFKSHKQPEKRRFFSFNRNRAQTKYYVTMTGSKSTELKRDRNAKSLYKIIITASAAVLLLLWLGLIIYLPYFRITRTNIKGLNIIKYDEINTFITDRYLNGGKIFPKRNYFLVRPGKIENDLSEKYSLKTVKVTKSFPNTLTIEVEEKITTIIYDNGASYSLLDKDGTVIKVLSEYGVHTTSTSTSTPPTPEPEMSSSTSTSTTVTTASVNSHKPDFEQLIKENGKLPILYDTRNIFIAEKQTGILDFGVIASIIAWRDIADEQGIGEVKYMETDNPAAGIRIYLNRPWHLIVDPISLTPEIQIQNLKTLLSSKDVKPVEYIDLRFEDRVYWK